MQKRFLHVGCGEKSVDQTTKGFMGAGWSEVRYDIDSEVNPDIVGTMTDMSYIDSCSYHALYSSHNIEHLYFHEVPVALKEFKRVLRDDGFAVITCPDIESICGVVAKGQLVEPIYVSPAGPISPIDIIYGFRRAISEGNTYMAHKTAFTKSYLVSSIKDAGFASVVSMSRGHPYYDLWALATVSQAAPEILQSHARDHFPTREGAR